MRFLIYIFVALSLWSSLAFSQEEEGFCPRLEGKRSGVCRKNKPGSTCIPGMSCGSVKVYRCLNESTFDHPIRTGGVCISSETQCTVTPEGRKCEQVCTQWSESTCYTNKISCCAKYEIINEMPMTCCASDKRCCPACTPDGRCAQEPPGDDGKKLPLCGLDGSCG